MARRTNYIRVPATDEEQKEIREKAKSYNLPVATYLRNLALQDKKREDK